MKTRIPTQAEYEQNERARYHAERECCARAPLVERQEARDNWLDAMRNTPEIVGERVAWLLDGNYGKGAMDVAHEIARSRMNRTAALGQMIADLEWLCPPDSARAAWYKLTKAEQNAVTIAIGSALETWIGEQEDA